MNGTAWHEKLDLLEAKISCLESELNELKGGEPERWRPGGDFLDSLTEIYNFNYESNGICYFPLDREDVKYLLIKELARELNDGWVPDWSNPDKVKIGICYSRTRKLYESLLSVANQACSWYVDSDKEQVMLDILNRGDIDILVKEVCG